jgi:hypothetical protein
MESGKRMEKGQCRWNRLSQLITRATREDLVRRIGVLVVCGVFYLCWSELEELGQLIQKRAIEFYSDV